MRPEDISAISLGPSVTQVPALERGFVDVVLAQGVTISFLQRRHPDLRLLFDTRTPELTRAALGADEVPLSVLVAQENWLHSNPDTARRLAGAFQCALSWIQEHTAKQIREALPASCRSPDQDADLDAISSSKQMLSRTGRMSPEMHEAALRVSGAAGQISMQQVFTNDFLGEP